METKRTMTVDTEMFEVGDVLAFSLNDGEKVQAMAVEETPAGMLFVLVDCLDKEYPMFEKVKRGMSYMTSDLRRNLNGEILARFPEEIKSRMVAVNPEGDLLRIPTEREIFGKNPYGEPEDECGSLEADGASPQPYRFPRRQRRMGVVLADESVQGLRFRFRPCQQRR